MPDPDILAPLWLGFLLSKTQQISIKPGSEKNDSQITIIRIFLSLWERGSLFPYQLLCPVKAVTPKPLDFHLDVKPCPALPELPEFSFPPLEGESGHVQAPCWDVLGSYFPQREKCVGEEICFGMTWKQKHSLRKGVKLVANLTSGSASISSVNFTAVILKQINYNGKAFKGTLSPYSSSVENKQMPLPVLQIPP